MRLPRIAIWSTFRDDAGDNIRVYQNKVDRLDYPKNLLRFYLVEGDSTDSTYDELLAWREIDERVNLIKLDTGLPRHGHDTSPERFKVLSDSNNAALNMICYSSWAQMAMLIESDLHYHPFVIRDLLERKPKYASIVAPMVWIATETSKRFYDIWAYRNLGGEQFSLDEYEWYQENYPQNPFEVESAGSMLLMDMSVLRSGCRYTPQEVVRGMCLLARGRGYHTFVIPSVHIMHPPHREGE